MFRNLKQIMAPMLLIAMLLSVCPATLASNVTPTYLGRISETTDSEGRVIRSFRRSSVARMASDDGVAVREQTKKLLLELGMEQDSIDNLTTNELAYFESGTEITTAVSYCKVDVNGNTTYISEAEALQEAAILNSVAAANGTTQDYTEDSYMRVYTAATYLGSARYHFTTDARWLTMPLFRGQDAIGAAALNCTVTPNTAEGYYSYDYINTSGGKVSTGSSGKLSFKSIQTASDTNNFYGAAGILKLPVDASDGAGGSFINHNLFAHFSYESHVFYPTLETWFNMTGSYIHTTIGLQTTPSLSISSKGVSGSISLKIVSLTESRNVPLEVHYIP